MKPSSTSVGAHINSPWSLFLAFFAVSMILLNQRATALQVTTPASHQSPSGSTEEEPRGFFTSPEIMRQVGGKFPASLQIVLLQNNCQPSADSTVRSDPNSSYEVIAAGPGLSIGPDLTVGNCKIVATLTIDGTVASPGFYRAEVIKTTRAGGTSTTTDLGYGIINLAFPSAAPIPDRPEVDVIWGVLSKHMCSDNFGNHVGKDVYCIEVKIGNNSAYPIQLAGLGFELASAGDHKICTPEEMAANKDPKVCVLPSQKMPNLSYQSVRASAQSSQSRTARNLLVNGTEGFGILMASFNPLFRAAWSVTRWTTGIDVVGTALPKAISTVVPDLTIGELNNLDDESFRDGKMIPNNTQVRTMVFIEKRALDGAGGAAYQYWCGKLYSTGSDGLKKCQKSKDDPSAVKLALGKIIIVGDKIKFIERVVVDPSVTSQEVSPSGTNPPAVPQVSQATNDGNSVTVTFSGNVKLPPSASATVQPQAGGATITLGPPSPGADPTEVQFNLPKGTTLTTGQKYNLSITGTTPATTTFTAK